MLSFKINQLLEKNKSLNIGYVDSNIPHTISYADNDKFFNIANNNTNISYIITSKKIAERYKKTKNLIIVDDPRGQFYETHRHFLKNNLYEIPFKPFIGNKFNKHESAKVHEGCHIGDNVCIEENVIIKNPTLIGSNVKICSGSKIGFDGILYEKKDDKIQLIEHAGYVKISNDVTIMSNAHIIRSIHLDCFTEIGCGSLIGMETTIGHEVKVLKRAIISNKCLVARRSIIDNDAFLGTGSIIKEHLHVGEGSKVMAGSVVIKNVKDGERVSGNFATNHDLRLLNFFRKNELDN